MDNTPKYEMASIVVLGAFAPATFHPRWFSDMGLIRVEEANSATDVTMIPQLSLTRFVADWLTVDVQNERFAVLTENPAMFTALEDLAIGVFTLLEPATFVKVGFNRHMEFNVETEEEWHEIGHMLAPKSPWDGTILSPGMRKLVMEGQRPNIEPHRFQFTAEPSPRCTPGLSVSANEEYDLTSDGTSTEARAKLLRLIGSNWRGCLSFSLESAKKILTRGRKP